jgi:hypothetical protein
LLRCHHPESLALSADQAKWGQKRLRIYEAISYAGVNGQRVLANYMGAARMLEAVCGIKFEWAPIPALAEIVATSGPIDGPWNVLALSELPNSPDFMGRLHQTFDQAEQLDDNLMVAMMAHELCHCLGLGHLPAGNLMAPVLDPSITTPQPGDIAELQARYGPPAASAPSVPAADPPAPTGQSIAVEIAGVGTLTLQITAGSFTPAQAHTLSTAATVPTPST